jgi:hypothetical protein
MVNSEFAIYIWLSDFGIYLAFAIGFLVLYPLFLTAFATGQRRKGECYFVSSLFLRISGFRFRILFGSCDLVLPLRILSISYI